MPRPHSLPRRAPPSPSDPVFPPFRPVEPTRVLGSVNVRRDDKAFFDAWQSWLSYKEGRSVQQWEAFRELLLVALESGSPRMRGFQLPVASAAD